MQVWVDDCWYLQILLWGESSDVVNDSPSNWPWAHLWMMWRLWILELILSVLAVSKVTWPPDLHLLGLLLEWGPAWPAVEAEPQHLLPVLTGSTASRIMPENTKNIFPLKHLSTHLFIFSLSVAFKKVQKNFSGLKTLRLMLKPVFEWKKGHISALAARPYLLSVSSWQGKILQGTTYSPWPARFRDIVG